PNFIAGMNFFQSDALKQLKKIMKDHSSGESADAQKNLDNALKHITKKLLKEKQASNLVAALLSKDKSSVCVLVKGTPDAKRRGSIDGGNTHILSCRIFRFPWIHSVNDVKSTQNCPNSYKRGAEPYCINPYHYEPPHAKVPPVVVERDRFAFPEGGLREVPDDDFIPNHTLSPDNPAFVRRRMNLDDDEMGSPESNFSEDIDMEDQGTEITPIPDRPGAFKVPFEETDFWLKISYWEGNHVIAKVIEVGGHQFIIDSTTNQSDSERLCVGYLTGMENVRDKKLEEIRRAIGRGVRLYYASGEIFIECLSEHPIFVQSPSANRRYGMAAASVVKVEPNTTLKIFNHAEFSTELMNALERGFESVHALIKLCNIRVSFVKGWGHEYSRKSINQTGCWFIAQFPAPVVWIDKVLNSMGAPPTFCGSVT
ncbi:hypothetical protein PFISCL1PPCAC_19788, partial [Pristionchus fissidentatus]